jgi:poly(3-hydroxybutyrate) depolymerase
MTAMDVMRRGARQDPVSLVDAAVDASAYPGMPAVIVHGDADYVVSPKNAEQLSLEFLRLNGLVDASGAPIAGSVRETRDGATLIRDYVAGGRRVVRLVLVGRLGHDWSGGDDAIPFHSSNGPDASALMWEFFRYQRRREQGVTSRAAAAGR